MITTTDLVNVLRAVVNGNDDALNEARQVLAAYDAEIAEQQRLSKLCKVCKTEPVPPGYDHCGAPDCIPF